MKRFLKKYYLLIILIIIQSIFYIITGCNKEYLHIDEVYSYGLASYDKVEIQDNKDFYNNWHSKDYYLNYFTVQEEELWDFKPVYENQKNDVHPPLYYLLLRNAMNLTPQHFTIWTGIILNIIIYAFITIFMYLILKRMFQGDEKVNLKSIILAFMASIILASLSNAIYIRMYALLTLEVLIITFLHIKLSESEKVNPKLFISIGIIVLSGILTHYYFLFYIFALYLLFSIKYIKAKRKKELLYYNASVVGAGVLSLIIFPYSIEHIFFGYRGKGAISNFEKIGVILSNIREHIHNLNYYAFNGMLLLILSMIAGSFIYNKTHKKASLQITKEQKEILKMIIFASTFFFILASIASPWRVLRYIVPVCGLIFVTLIYVLYKLFKTATSEKISSIIMMILFGVLLISPFICKLEPELLYKDKKEIVEKLEAELNLPALYLFETNNSNFLEDMYLFTKLNNSYIAKDIDYTEENIKEILKQKDTSNGIILFVPKSEKEDVQILKTVEKSINSKEAVFLKELNSCKVYYIKNTPYCCT